MTAVRIVGLCGVTIAPTFGRRFYKIASILARLPWCAINLIVSIYAGSLELRGEACKFSWDLAQSQLCSLPNLLNRTTQKTSCNVASLTDRYTPLITFSYTPIYNQAARRYARTRRHMQSFMTIIQHNQQSFTIVSIQRSCSRPVRSLLLFLSFTSSTVSPDVGQNTRSFVPTVSGFRLRRLRHCH